MFFTNSFRFSCFSAYRGNILAVVTALLLLCTSAPFAGAQGLPGYVALATGDTLHGFVAEVNSKKVLFYEHRMRQARSFSPAEASGYGLHGNAPYTSFLVRLALGHDSLLFVRPTLTGPASLYQTMTDRPEYYLRPPATDTLYQLSATNWHLLYSRYLSACSSLQLTELRVLDLPFERRWIEELVVKYNRCVLPTWHRATTSSARHRIQVVARAGSNASARLEAPGSPTFRPGLDLGVELRQLHSTGWWLGISLEASQLRGGPAPFQVYSGTSLFTITRTDTYALRSVNLAGNVGRNFGSAAGIRPFVYVGVAGGLLLHSYYNTRHTYTNNFYPTITERFDKSQQLLLQGRLGTGLWVPLNPAHDVQVALQYAQMLVTPSPALRVHSISMQVGYAFSVR